MPQGHGALPQCHRGLVGRTAGGVCQAVSRRGDLNKKINPELETMFLTASGKYTFLSSSVVREMAYYGADLTGLVPSELIEEIETKARQWRLK